MRLRMSEVVSCYRSWITRRPSATALSDCQLYDSQYRDVRNLSIALHLIKGNLTPPKLIGAKRNQVLPYSELNLTRSDQYDGYMSKKPDWLFDQAGALPYLPTPDEVQVVLVTSLSSGRWIFPKGVIDPGETPESTAAKEAREEAGVIGEVTGDSLGIYSQEKWGGVANIRVFPLKVLELLQQWDEQSARKREVLSVQEASKRVNHKLAAILATFEKRLQLGLFY